MTQPPDPPSAFTAGPATPIGRAGELRAIGVTIGLLKAEGYTVEQRPSRDSHGEDAVIAIGGVGYTAQVTTVPDAPVFWREAKHGSAVTQATAQHEASWLEQSIAKKIDGMSGRQRANTIIVLDVHDWGDRLAQPEIVAKLRESDLNPAQKHGLAGIAIAGTTPSTSTWLGGGLG